MKHPVNIWNTLAQIMRTSLGQTCSKLHTLFKRLARNSNNCIPSLGQRGRRHDTLSSGTFPYRPYKGVPAPPPSQGHFRDIKIHTWLRAGLREQNKRNHLGAFTGDPNSVGVRWTLNIYYENV